MTSAPDSSAAASILAIGEYVPRWRIARSVIGAAMGWARGRSKGGEGARSFAHWDEDALTMAVEACRQALSASQGAAPEALMLASTSMPFADRSNAGLVREALNLGSGIMLADLAGSRRSATTALAEVLQSPGNALRLLCASECVDTQPGSDNEADTGHAAAAVLTGAGPGLATLRAAGRLHEDFLDQYRMSDQRFDYTLEARWQTDAGIRKQLQTLIKATLDEAGLDAAEADWLLLPFNARVAKTVAKDCGLATAFRPDGLVGELGRCGAAQPLLMLSRVLREASPGQHIVLVGAGQGFDVLVLEVTATAPAALSAPLRFEENYLRYLGMRGLLDIDNGIRAERDNRSSQSAAYRRHAELNGFIGGRCPDCSMLQFPMAAICVHCHSTQPQQRESLAALTGEVNSFTEDWLAYTPRPPLIFGNVHFAGKANVLMEFTDFEAGELKAGQAVRMAFRIKDFDPKRGFRRYFWKPAPMQEKVDMGPYRG